MSKLVYIQEEERWDFVLSTRDKGDRCQVLFCRGYKPVRVSRGSTFKQRVCWRCHSARYRANNPARWAYHVIKDRAKRRGQIFALSFEEFCAVPNFNQYIASRGRGADELHIDRIKPHLGYIPGNLQILTAHDNCSKGAREKPNPDIEPW